MTWTFDTLTDDLARTLADAEAAVRLEQAVHGIDALDERGLQSILADGLAATHAVAREVHYPSTVGRKLTHRPRCDLVLSPAGRPLRLDARPPSLFDPADPCPPGEALWLEVKVAHQFAPSGGSGSRPHKGYGRQWREAVVNDLKKMEAEPAIAHAGLVLVVFTATDAVVERDLEAFEDVLAVREVLAGFRQVRAIPIVERIGHERCTVAVWPTVQRTLTG